MKGLRKIKAVCFTVLVMLAGHVSLAYGDMVTPFYEETVVAFGDSITTGKYSIPYSFYLQNLINDSGRSATVVNAGSNGELTINGVSRIDEILSSVHPTYILIMEGANDAIFFLSRATTTFNLSVMIEKSKANHAIPILSTITPNTQSDSPAMPEMYNPWIVSLANEKKVILVDSYENVAAGWAALNVDDLHPNPSGSLVLAQGFYSVIRPVDRLPISFVYPLLLK